MIIFIVRTNLRAGLLLLFCNIKIFYICFIYELDWLIDKESIELNDNKLFHLLNLLTILVKTNSQSND